NVRNAEGFERDTALSRRLGYRGRKLIHPSQIEPCNRLYRPSTAELDYYARVLEAFDQALAQGSAATTVDGRMIDAAMANAARRMLEADAAWKKAGEDWGGRGRGGGSFLGRAGRRRGLLRQRGHRGGVRPRRGARPERLGRRRGARWRCAAAATRSARAYAGWSKSPPPRPGRPDPLRTYRRDSASTGAAAERIRSGI